MATLSPNVSLPFPSNSSQTSSPSLTPTRQIPMSRSGSFTLSPSLPKSPQFSIPTTRTMAILMGSAAKVHRLAIQSRLNQAGFEILAERLESWTEDDQDFLTEFLAHEKEEQVDKWCRKLTANPLYVMVLERSDCAVTWQNLVGSRNDRDLKDAGDQEDDDEIELGQDGLPIQKKGNLKSTYGDLFYGSSSSEAAERQIGICFPELATPAALKALAREGFNTLSNSNEKDRDQVMLNSEDIVWDEQGFAYDSRTGQPLDLQEEYSYTQPMIKSQSGNNLVSPNPNSSVVFRARPMPASHKKASIQPRMSRAAALRMGIELPKIPRRTISDSTSQSSGSGGDKSSGPMGISGKPKAEVPIPRSLSKPSVNPRLNKAAAARMGVEVETTGSKNVREKKEADYSNTPGHKRASIGIKLASLAAPSIQPRANRSSQARTGASPQKETRTADSPIKERKPVDFSNTPGHRRLSTGPKPSSLAAPSIVPRSNRASAARGGRVEGELPSNMTESSSRQRLSSAPTHGRSSSVLSSSMSASANLSTEQKIRKEVDYSFTPGHRRPSLSNIPVASLAQPTITPRSNNAANARLRRGSVGSLQDLENRATSLGQVDLNAGLRGGISTRPSSRQSVNSSDAHQDGMMAPKKKFGGHAPPSSYRHSMIGMPTSRPVSRG